MESGTVHPYLVCSRRGARCVRTTQLKLVRWPDRLVTVARANVDPCLQTRCPTPEPHSSKLSDDWDGRGGFLRRAR